MFFIVLLSFTNFAFSKQKPVLVSRVDSLIVSLNGTSTSEEAIQKESEIYSLAKSINYEEGAAMGRIILISKLFSHQQYDKTIKFINESAAEGINFTPAYWIQLLLLKASSYNAIGLHPETNKILELAKSETTKLKKNYNYYVLMGQILVLTGYNIEITNGPRDKIISCYKDGYTNYAKVKYDVGMVHAASQLGYFYFENKHNDSTKKYLLAVPKIKDLDKKKSPEIRLISYLNPAILDFINKKYIESITKYNKVLNIIDSLRLSPYYKKQIYNCLIQVYDKHEDRKMEKFYLNKYAEISDSLNLSEKKMMKLPLQNIIEEKTHWAFKNNSSYALLLIFGTSLLTFGFIKLNKLKKSQIIVNENFQTESHLSINSLKHSESGNIDENLKKIIALARRNDPALYTNFNVFDPTFTQKLQLITTDLLPSELIICIFLRLNFETKEIARFANLSVRAVQGKKYRIRKKLKISSKEDLNIWMTNL